MLKCMLGTHKPFILFLNYVDLTCGCGLTLYPMHYLCTHTSKTKILCNKEFYTCYKLCNCRNLKDCYKSGHDMDKKLGYVMYADCTMMTPIES